MDFNPDAAQPPTVKSLDADIVVINVKVVPAPGASTNGPSVNPNMFIIETMSSDTTSMIKDDDDSDLNNTVARFRER
jgi:hypothetical protein